MARKMTRNNHVPASVASKSFAIDHSSRRGQSSRNHAHSDHTCIDNVETSQCERAGTGRSSARSSSSDDDADVSDADAAEADEEDDGDDDNGDALAPSGCAMNKHGNQAGRFKLVFKNGPLSSKRRRASSAGLESPDQNIKHARSSARNTTSYSEPSDSDDEAYNGVDLVSDANEDESDVEKFEEKGIIDSEDFNHVIPAFAVEDVGETTDGWEGFDLDNGFILPDIPYFAEQYGRNEPGILDSEIGIFQSASVFDDFEPITSPVTPAARRVRFKEPVPPPSDSSDIVSNDEDLNGLFNTNEAPLQTNGDVTFGFENEDDASCVGNSSGYETDYGDTTDEDDRLPTTRPQSLLRQPSLSSMDADAPFTTSAASSPFKIHSAPAGYPRGPRMGSWKVDPTKPCAMIDSTGDNMVIIPAKRPAKINTAFGQVGSTRTSTACPSPITPQPRLASAVDDSDADFNDFSSQVIKDPMLGSGPDVISFAPPPSIASSQGHDQTFADASVFFPMDSMGDFSAIYEVDDQHDDDDDDDEALLNVEDFIDFGVDSSDDDAEEDEDAIARATLPTPHSTSPTVLPSQIPAKTPSPDNTSTSDLLKHFDKGVIGAFRRSPPNHQQHLRRSQARPSLNKHAFKGGRYSAADAQLGLQKKRKLSGTFGPHPSYAAVAKRKLAKHR